MKITIDPRGFQKVQSWCIVLLLCWGTSFAFSQTNIVYHSFNSGIARSVGNSAVVVSMLGQTIFGSSSANGLILQSGYTAYSKGIVTGVAKKEEPVPKEFVLHQNYPNPFNPSTTIAFTIPLSGFTTLKVYDAIGREVATLVNERLEEGVRYTTSFVGTNFSSGMYIARLQSEGKVQLRKMLLLK